MSTRLRLRPTDLSWRSLDGEVVALDTRASLYVGANPSGALLWERLANGATRPELTEALTSAYGIDAANAEADVTRFLAQLADAGLLESTEPA